MGIKIPGAPGANPTNDLPVAATTTNAVQDPGNPARILQGGVTPNTNFFKKLNLPPSWKTNLPMETISEVISTIIKFIVNLLQVFMMFIRPFNTRMRNRWTMWFASSLQQLQIFLGLGGIAGNYGGVIDDVQVG